MFMPQFVSATDCIIWVAQNTLIDHNLNMHYGILQRDNRTTFDELFTKFCVNESIAYIRSRHDSANSR